MPRIVIYGAFGWCAEIVWTALWAALTGVRGEPGAPGGCVALDRAERVRLVGHTYLWMFPIYGLGGLVFEACHEAARAWPWAARGALWTALIFAVEYAAGWLLRRLLGGCPWDYGRARFSVGGLIRVDYAPAWFAFGLLLERLHDALR